MNPILPNAAAVTVTARRDQRAPSFNEMMDMFREAISAVLGPDVAATTVCRWNASVVGFQLGHKTSTDLSLSVMSADILPVDPAQLAEAMLTETKKWSVASAPGRGRTEWGYMGIPPAKFKEKTASLLQVTVIVGGDVYRITYEEWKV